MTTIYPDQNALIALGRKARRVPYDVALRSAVSDGRLSVVVSPWHIVETAHTSNVKNAVELAEFIDGLRPAYLLERHDLLQIEIHKDFFQFAGIRYDAPPPITSKSAAIAALRRKKDHPRYSIPMRNFVEQWIAHPEQMEPMEQAYKTNADALRRLRELRSAGKLTQEFERRANRKMLEVFLPRFTPSGIDVGRELRMQYLEQADIKLIPTLAIETAISNHEWGAKGGEDWNTLIDKFHLISALAYVDEIVSDDKFFHRVYPFAVATGHVQAKLTGTAALMAQVFGSAASP